jgi:hypothetical protein
MPDEGEVLALLALMLLHDARRDARIRDDEIVLLDDQDCALWDDRQISEGRELLQQAITRGETGSYAVQAAIADLHLQQPRDWRQIAALYHTLSVQTGSPRPLPLLPLSPRRAASSRRARRRGAPRIPTCTRTRPDRRRTQSPERPTHPTLLRLSALSRLEEPNHVRA